jgi:hypothetical protein
MTTMIYIMFYSFLKKKLVSIDEDLLLYTTAHDAHGSLLTAPFFSFPMMIVL